MSRVVIAAPLFNGGAHLDEALTSLLAQTHGDLRLVLVDDASDDATADIARAHAGRDPRVSVHVNPRRLGMLANTNRALELAAEQHPEAEFRALASDHDRWAARWLERLVAALDAHPAAVLAYPLSRRIDGDGAPVWTPKPPWRCQTAGIREPRRRMRAAYRCMVAGDMIYGLFRAAALDRVGGYRPVLVPDRLLLAQAARLGEFVQVDELLWERRFVGLAELDRQRAAFFLDGAPAYTRLPWWLTHVGVGWREHGPAFAADLLGCALRLRAVRRAQRLRLHAGRALERPTRLALASPRFRALVRERRLPVGADTQAVLERMLEERELC